MSISKFEGVLFSVPCILLYYFVFRKYNIYYFGHAPSIDWWSTRLFIVGAVIHMMYLIPAGETGEVTFGGKTTERRWSNGLCFVPNLFHFTITSFNFAILWGLTLNSVRYYESGRIINAEVIIDQRMPSYHHNVQMSHLGATIDRTFNVFIMWLFGWKRGEPHLVFMRFGFRLMFVAYVMVTIFGLLNHGKKQVERGVTATESTVQDGVAAVGSALGVPPQQKRTITVNVQLIEGLQPVMPTKDSFELSESHEDIYNDQVDKYGRKYYRSKKINKDGKSLFIVSEAACLVIPSGMKVYIATERRPIYAVNMKQDVEFGKLWYSFSWKDWKTIILEERTLRPVLITKESWQYVYKNWKKVSDKHFLVVQAENSTVLREETGQEQEGGLVCF